MIFQDITNAGIQDKGDQDQHAVGSSEQYMLPPQLHLRQCIKAIFPHWKTSLRDFHSSNSQPDPSLEHGLEDRIEKSQ